jgi:predicted lysophospholipase L1 biosynthesis ABC-type transport system permease subunit
MEDKLVYLTCLRNEIVNGQNARNTFVGLKITAIGVLVTLAFDYNPKLIVFAALLAAIMDFAILGLSIMIIDISEYIRDNIESSFESFIGWELYLKNNPKNIGLSRSLVSLSTGSGLTIVIIVLSIYGYFNFQGTLSSQVLTGLPYLVILFLSIILWIISTFYANKTGISKLLKKGES